MSISKEIILKANQHVKTHQSLVGSDPYRLHYHLMPTVGLLNDPNGFVFYKGQYHVFYQWNPFVTAHGPKFWGHYVSTDLVHWKEAPAAIAPGDWYDKDGCYSGSAAVLGDTLYLFYTGNVKDEEGNRESYQCLAVSNDGIHFEKKGPIIHVPEGYTAHFRDPKVFLKDEKWYMVLGAQTIEEAGVAVLYSSPDLEEWTFMGTMAGSGYHGLGDLGYMWECPDLVELGGTDILLVCPQGMEPEGFQYQNMFQSGYIAGKVDYIAGEFAHGPFVEMDRGFDFYAPQTMEDPNGRRLLFGWMGNAVESDVQQPTTAFNWIHALTLPRELRWENGKLLQTPVEELKLLRGQETLYKNVNLDDDEQLRFHGQVFEMEMSIDRMEGPKGVTLTIQIGESKLIYNQREGVFTFERKSYYMPNQESRHCYLQELKKIRLFKDTSSIEIFLNDGEEVFTSRVFDDFLMDEVVFETSGEVTMNLQKWDLNRVTSY
ncbi:sucrose-6-phosphate hydrolase [Oceanobacillus piezotolerans]|uniref:Sucrose-6-phosphate hydrolase n=1 Tax=Oceanobacillus piezotolerans TaxID=2448030 RepID=A0A498DJ53_9BACI|nr:sucrose-6-phosphate hydrolase [Oceanobacillus piezotolerans]RLL41796.1 sucrose-6-phosphate hydrolase [Oceanobacillus piezotolerans]